MTPSHASSFSLFFFIDLVFVIRVRVSFLSFSIANLAIRFMPPPPLILDGYQ